MKKIDKQKDKQKDKVKEILQQHDIKISIGGCGCCGSPSVSFEHKGKKIVDNVDDFTVTNGSIPANQPRPRRKEQGN